MSAAYWKSLAAARDVADVDLRSALVEALYERDLAQDERDEAEAQSSNELDEARSECDGYAEILQAVSNALGDETTWDDEESLVKAIGVLRQPDVAKENALRHTQARAKDAEIADLQARLDATRALVESYSDLVAVAQYFVGRAKASGVPRVRTVRLVKESGS